MFIFNLEKKEKNDITYNGCFINLPCISHVLQHQWWMKLSWFLFLTGAFPQLGHYSWIYPICLFSLFLYFIQLVIILSINLFLYSPHSLVPMGTVSTLCSQLFWLMEGTSSTIHTHTHYLSLFLYESWNIQASIKTIIFDSAVATQCIVTAEWSFVFNPLSHSLCHNP